MDFHDVMNYGIGNLDWDCRRGCAPNKRLHAFDHECLVGRRTNGWSEKRRCHKRQDIRISTYCCATPTTCAWAPNNPTPSSRSIPTRSNRQSKVTSGKLSPAQTQEILTQRACATFRSTTRTLANSQDGYTVQTLV
jgi:hypothetical protein